MRTLESFWAWVDGEKPDWALALEKMRHNLSWTAQDALEAAARSIARRLVLPVDEPLACLDVLDHRDAMRDLSLAFCAVLEVMHERVEKPCPDDILRRLSAIPDDTFLANISGDSAPPTAVAYIPTLERYARACRLLAQGLITGAQWETVVTGEFSPDLPDPGDDDPLRCAEVITPEDWEKAARAWCPPRQTEAPPPGLPVLGADDGLRPLVDGFAVTFLDRLMRGKEWQIPGWSLEDVRRVAGGASVEVVYSLDGTCGLELECASFLVPVSEVSRARIERELREGTREFIGQLSALHSAFARRCAEEFKQS
jgi:hypothetical protein